MSMAQSLETPVGPFGFLRQLVHGSTGIVLEGNKEYLFESRLSRILKEEGLPSFDALVTRLKGLPTSATLRQRVVEAMTTNETLFFRDAQPFEAMRKHILPGLAESRRPERSLAMWSAAASTGQELYSLAMLVRDLGTRFDGWNVRLVGTDISSDVLARARAGRYSQIEVNRGLPAPMLIKHFKQQGAEWQIKDELRRMCEFRPLNLIEPWPAMPRFDVVMLRNVLIYFDVPTKRQILARIADVLRPGGVLFLGSVETTLNLSSRFAETYLDKVLCYRAIAPGES